MHWAWDNTLGWYSLSYVLIWVQFKLSCTNWRCVQNLSLLFATRCDYSYLPVIFTSISSRYKVIRSMNLYLYFGFNTHYDWSKFLFFSHYNTARVFVNCADEFHTLRCRVVRCIYMIFFACTVEKKCATHVPLLFRQQTVAVDLLDLRCWWSSWEGKCHLLRALKHVCHWASNEINSH